MEETQISHTQGHNAGNIRKHDGFSIASFVLAIFGLLFFWAHMISGLSIVLALIFGIISLKSHGKQDKYALAGVIIASIAIVLSIVVMILMFTTDMSFFGMKGGFCADDMSHMGRGMRGWGKGGKY